MAPRPVAVTVTYFKPGTQPPVFVAGSFSDPEWQPQEMQYEPKGDDLEYYKEVHIEAGKEYQFKFRIGNGDWWVLDEQSPTVTDDAGNRNNLLTIPTSEETAIEKEVGPATSSTSMAEDTSAPSVSNAEDLDAISIEERMGTREPSDVLFDDEIVKDTDEEQARTSEGRPETTSSMEPPPGGRFEKDNLEGKTPITTEEAGSEIKETENAKESTAAEEITTDLSAAEESTLGHVPEQQEIDSAEAQPVADNREIAPASDFPREGPIEPLPTPAVEDVQLKGETGEDGQQINIGGKESSLSPSLFLENVDTELRQSEHSGTEAGSAPRAVEHLRADAAGPDYRSQTPEFAAVASEVANSAAKLDQDEPTPPVSDEEAGRIGYRRMSSTPIPQVAATAAEVADSAATLDRDEPTPPISDEEAGRSGLGRISHVSIPQVAETAAEVADVAPNLDREDQQYVFVEDPYIPGLKVPLTPDDDTPESEQVPRLPHEVPTPADHIEPAREQVIELPGPPSYIPRVPDPNDPSYEPFPTDRAGIMEHLRRLQERLPEDEVKLDIPISPSVSGNHHAEKNLPEPSPILIEETSPLLEPITEENDEGQDENNASKAPETNGVDAPAMEVLSRVDVVTSELEEVSSASEGHASTKELLSDVNVVTAKLEGASSTENTKLSGRAEEAVPEEATPKPEEGLAKPGSIIDEPVVGITGGTEENVAVPDLEEDQGKHHVEVRPVNHPIVTGNMIHTEIPSGADHFVPSLTTPFVVGDTQLGHNDAAHEIRTGQDSPKITFSPATPGTSIRASDPFENSTNKDLAKSSGIDDESGVPQVKARKPLPPTPPERPITPSSMRSAGKEAHERNFLKAFWRVIFVDWIGGFILRLCGGGRRRTALLAVGAITVFAVAPALYYLR